MELELVKQKVNDYLDSIKSPMLDRFRGDFSFGKMLRSKLILAIAPDSPKNAEICAIIELIHFASLLHDDVIDNATLRRGTQSINAKYGDKNAIMLGDILYSKAFFEIAKIDYELNLPSTLAKIISNAVLDLSLGELEDVALSQSFNENCQKYITMITHKTAALIQASGLCAGVISKKDSMSYGIYGLNLGIAFQIIDDLLDISQSQETLGKAAFSDLQEGKTTLPYIFLYKLLGDEEREKLLRLFKKELNEKQKSWITQQMNEYGIFTKVQNLAQDYGKKALNALDSNASDKLKSIALEMINRKF